MNITIAAVGRLKSGPEKHLWDDYARRLTWSVQLKEVEEKKPLPPNKCGRKKARYCWKKFHLELWSLPWTNRESHSPAIILRNTFKRG